MVDRPWKGRQPTPGQIAQRLMSIGCRRTQKISSRVQGWKPPIGPEFTIILDDCSDEQIEGIVKQVKKWANENDKK